MLPMASPQIGAPGLDVHGSKTNIPTLQATALDELRVSQMIREYNMRQPDSPSAYFAAGETTQYMSDTDLFLTRRNFRSSSMSSPSTKTTKTMSRPRNAPASAARSATTRRTTRPSRSSSASSTSTTVCESSPSPRSTICSKIITSSTRAPHKRSWSLPTSPGR